MCSCVVVEFGSFIRSYDVVVVVIIDGIGITIVSLPARIYRCGIVVGSGESVRILRCSLAIMISRCGTALASCGSAWIGLSVYGFPMLYYLG